MTQIEKRDELNGIINDLIIQNYDDMRQNYKVNPAWGQFRCSTLAYCPRKIILNSLALILETLDFDTRIISSAEIVDTTDDGLQALADSGTIMHALAQLLLGKGRPASTYRLVHEGDVFWREEKIRFYGHIDTQIFDLKSDKIHVVDIKTKDDINDIDKYGLDFHHVKQLTLYLHYVWDKYPDKDVRGAIWYLQRKTDDFTDLVDLFKPENWRLFPVSYNHDLYWKLVRRATQIHAQLTKHLLLPPRTNEAFQCRNKRFTCPFYPICFESDVKDIPQVVSLLEDESFLKKLVSYT